MSIFEFTIIASGLDPHADDFEDQFYEVGCDDATISFQKGHILVDFGREATSLVDAISSAVEDVRKTGAKVDRVEPDPLVSLADMAARSNLSRAALSNYASGQRGDHFPAPKVKVTTDSPLWDWADGARWLYQQHRVTKDVAVFAMVVSEANDVLDCCEADFSGSLHRRVNERLPAYA